MSSFMDNPKLNVSKQKTINTSNKLLRLLSALEKGDKPNFFEENQKANKLVVIR